MGVVESRAFIPAGDDAYWCPLSAVQKLPDVWAGYLVPIWTGQPPLTCSTRLTAAVAGEAVTWTERQLVVRSR